MKRDDFDRDLVGLLVFWWNYERSRSLAILGYPPECPSCREYITSRQYDDQNGAFDTDERGMLARNIGKAVDSIDEPWRTALYVLARNRATGVHVWSSERIKGDKEQVLQICDEAIAKLSLLV